MALPTVADCKSYLKVENTIEDALFAQLLTRALLMVQRYIGCALVAVSVTSKDRGDTDVFYSRGPTSLIAPKTPFDPTTLALTDKDGTAISNADLEIDGDSGIIRYADGHSRFENGPYTIVATVGLSALPNYATELEGLAGMAIVDLVADLYQRRSPGAKSESAAGGVSRSWTETEIPPRICSVLDALVRPDL